MLRCRSWPVALFAIWTLFVWVQRVVNIFGDETLRGADRWGALVRPVVFVAIGVAVAMVAVRPMTAVAARRIVWAGGGLTIALWLVQSVLIATRDYSVGFIVVHIVLGVVSVSLAAWAMRSVGHISDGQISDDGASHVVGAPDSADAARRSVRNG